MSLANAGVLDALATRLASIVVAQGLVIPGAELVAQKEGLLDCFPSAAPRNADLAGILEAIAVIIADSKFRASQLVYSNAIMAVFPTSTPDFQPNRSTKAAWSAFNATDLSGRRSRLNALDYLIPHIPLSRTKSSSALSSAFPPLGTPSSFEHLAQLGESRIPSWSRSPSLERGILPQDNASSELNEPESPLIPYLIWLTRSTRHLERLMAASVLTVLYRAGLTDKSRETALGLLTVPVLVQLLRDGKAEVRSDEDPSLTFAERLSMEWKIKELAPAVLAMLIVDSEYLQKSAFDSGVISILSEMIKAAYEPVLEGSDSRTWSPSAGTNTPISSSGNSQNPRLGQVGQSPLLVHKIKVRESTLRAIAALVPFKDEYRKALIDQGVVPYIVESLKSYPDKPSSKASEKTEKLPQIMEENKVRSPGFGTNPVSVLIAACGAVRHLSRSVSILRTTLIDNGVVMPVFALLQHSEIDVQISATATTCNLVMDFSPMREVNMTSHESSKKLISSQTIAAAGVLKILCEHAHSGNVKLRLNALWALKHLVQSAGNDVKKTCLEELGQGWLVQLICDDTEDEALSSSKPRSGPFGFNEGTEDDVQMDQFEEEDEPRMGNPLGSLGNIYNNKAYLTGSRPSSSRGSCSVLTNTRLAALRDLETNPARRARKDDIAVQEQGLDFIRNLIGGFNNVGTSETSEMIDFLLNALGQDQIFDILASKLKFKVINPFNKRNSAGNGETRLVPPQAEIIAAVEYILVHMAASVPRHRQLVISQTELLKLLVPQFNHPNKEVRLALCWLVINLTWVDDAHDGQACAQRAQELKKLGFLAKLESMEHDIELDVRERAKTAVWQMKQGY
jgi:armadillo repeat-containing protein 8